MECKLAGRGAHRAGQGSAAAKRAVSQQQSILGPTPRLLGFTVGLGEVGTQGVRAELAGVLRRVEVAVEF